MTVDNRYDGRGYDPPYPTPENQLAPPAPESCPKCGAAISPEDNSGYTVFECGSLWFHEDRRYAHSPRCKIAELEQTVFRLTEQLRMPHPARDFVQECNEALAAKDAVIARLSADVERLTKFRDAIQRASIHSDHRMMQRVMEALAALDQPTLDEKGTSDDA